MSEQIRIRPSIGFWERLILLTVIGTIAWNNPNPSHNLQVRPTVTPFPTFIPTDVPTSTPTATFAPTATSTITASPTPTRKPATPTRKPTLIPKVAVSPTPTKVASGCTITLIGAEKLGAGILKTSGRLNLQPGQTARCQIPNGGRDTIAVPSEGITIAVKPNPESPSINNGSPCDKFNSTRVPENSLCAVVESRHQELPWNVEIKNMQTKNRDIEVTLIAEQRTYDCPAPFWEDLKGVTTLWTKDCR